MSHKSIFCGGMQTSCLNFVPSKGRRNKRKFNQGVNGAFFEVAWWPFWNTRLGPYPDHSRSLSDLKKKSIVCLVIRPHLTTDSAIEIWFIIYLSALLPPMLNLEKNDSFRTSFWKKILRVFGISIFWRFICPHNTCLLEWKFWEIV